MDQVRDLLRDTLLLDDTANDLAADSPLLGVIAELDSVGVVSVLTAMEEELEIEVEDDEISAAVFETLGTLTTFVEGKPVESLQP